MLQAILGVGEGAEDVLEVGQLERGEAALGEAVRQLRAEDLCGAGSVSAGRLLRGAVRLRLGGPAHLERCIGPTALLETGLGPWRHDGQGMLKAEKARYQH